MPSFSFPPDAGSGGGGGGGLASVPMQNTVWVCKPPIGNNATGLRNRIDKPFATIQAAIAAALSGDVIMIFPGVYDEAVVMADKLLAFQGTSEQGVVISPVAPGVPFTWVVGAAGMSRFSMKNLKLASGGIMVGTSLVLDGSAFADFGSDGIILDNVEIDEQGGGDAVRIVRANVVNGIEMKTQGGPIRLNECGDVRLQEVEASSFDIRWNPASPLPANGRVGVVLEDCLATQAAAVSLTLRNAPKVYVGEGTILRGRISATTLSSTALFAPDITIRGRVEGTLGSHTFTLPDPAIAPMIVDLGNATLFGDWLFTTPVNPGLVRQVIECGGTIFKQTGAVGSRIRGGDFIDVHAKGSTYLSRTIFFPTTGTPDQLGVDCDYSTFSVVLPGGPFVFVGIIFPFWSGSTPVPKVFAQETGPLAAGDISVRAVTRSDITLDSTLPGFADVMVVNPVV